jgi:hypothetical protein
MARRDDRVASGRARAFATQQGVIPSGRRPEAYIFRVVHAQNGRRADRSWQSALTEAALAHLGGPGPCGVFR